MALESCKKIIDRLIAAGFSQKRISEEAGVEQSTISRIYTGDHQDPKSSVLINLHAFADRVLPKPSGAEGDHPLSFVDIHGATVQIAAKDVSLYAAVMAEKVAQIAGIMCEVLNGGAKLDTTYLQSLALLANEYAHANEALLPLAEQAAKLNSKLDKAPGSFRTVMEGDPLQ